MCVHSDHLDHFLFRHFGMQSRIGQIGCDRCPSIVLWSIELVNQLSYHLVHSSWFNWAHCNHPCPSINAAMGKYSWPLDNSTLHLFDWLTDYLVVFIGQATSGLWGWPPFFRYHFALASVQQKHGQLAKLRCTLFAFISIMCLFLVSQERKKMLEATAFSSSLRRRCFRSKKCHQDRAKGKCVQLEQWMAVARCVHCLPAWTAW